YPESFDYICGSAARRHTAIAMFGDAHTRSGDGESGRSRDVECSAGVAASTAGIDQGIALSTTHVECGVSFQDQGSGCLAYRFGEADDLLYSFALHVQRDQQRRNLRVGCGARENLSHDLACHLAREGSTVVRDLMQRLNDHC